jgi:hypothetical protein
MHKTICIAASIVLLGCLSAQANETVLSRDYPYSVVFMQMLIVGLGDYAVANHQYPADLAQLEQSGFLPYTLAPQTAVEYATDGVSARFSSPGDEATIGGTPLGPFTQEIRELPSPDLYQIGQIPVPEPGPDGELTTVLRERKVWNWRGAEWLDAGYSWDNVALGLKASRLRIMLYWATYDYTATSNGQLPRDFAELEEYIGLQRNPAGWTGLTLVNSIDELSLYPGTIFVGYDYQGDWRVSANLGPKIQETIWSWRDGELQQSSTETYY